MSDFFTHLHQVYASTGPLDINPLLQRLGLRGEFQVNPLRSIPSALLPYLLVFAGLILFIFIIISGFQMLTGVTDPKAQEAAKQRLTAAIAGFLILFLSYWLIQILQVLLGVDILG